MTDALGPSLTSETLLREGIRRLERNLADYKSKNTKRDANIRFSRANAALQGTLDLMLDKPYDPNLDYDPKAAAAFFGEQEYKPESDYKPEAAKSFFGAAQKPVKPSVKITDFGEYLTGAKKDRWQRYTEAMAEGLPIDPRQIVVSKHFPEPDYQDLLNSMLPPRRVAAMKAIRDLVPKKPISGWKLNRWAELVKGLHEVLQRIATDASLTDAEFESVLGKFPTVKSRVDFYEALGFPAFLSAKDWSVIQSRSYHQFYDYDVRGKLVTYAEKNGRIQRDMVSLNPDPTAAIKEVAEKVKKQIEQDVAAEAAKPKGVSETKFYVYQDNRTGEFFIGKKGLTSVIRIKAGFKTAAEARLYQSENMADLLRLWEELRRPPTLRKPNNLPREGTPRRDGDVSPEQFTEAFGFRGVQFGNWVEGDRRQADLNEAFDALMDLAEAIGVPPKALSLNGSLGLAFGARGTGGKDAAKAHYEPGTVVINLTKQAGAGSLAHEWFHALDNYFARLERTGSTEVKSIEDFASRSAIGIPANVRPEVWRAFEEIRKVLNQGSFSERSLRLDNTRSSPYYSKTIEKAARAFEIYVAERLKRSGISNDYLVNIAKEGIDAYPSAEEMEQQGIKSAMDALFNTLETKPTPKGVMLFARRPKTKEELQAELDALQAEGDALLIKKDFTHEDASRLSQIQKRRRQILDQLETLKNPPPDSNQSRKPTPQSPAADENASLLPAYDEEGNPIDEPSPEDEAWLREMEQRQRAEFWEAQQRKEAEDRERAFEAMAAKYDEMRDPLAPSDSSSYQLNPIDRGLIARLNAATATKEKFLDKAIQAIVNFFKGFKQVPELASFGNAAQLGRMFKLGLEELKNASARLWNDAATTVSDIIAPIVEVFPDTKPDLQLKIRQLYQQLDAELNRQERTQKFDSSKIKPIEAQIRQLEAEMNQNPYHIFRQIVIYQDLAYRVKLPTKDGGIMQLPYGLTPEAVNAHLENLYQALTAMPAAVQNAVKESLRRHYAVVESLKQSLLERGHVIPQELANPVYFPHFVLDFFNNKLERVKITTAEDFRGYLQRLTGSEREIETDYLKAMMAHIAQVTAHNTRQDVVEKYWQSYDVKAEVERRARERSEKEGRIVTWQEVLHTDPDFADYEVYVVDDKIPLRPEAIINRRALEQKLGVAINEGDLQAQLREMGITLTADDVTMALAAGEKPTWIVPKAVKKAIQGVIAREQSEAARALEAAGIGTGISNLFRRSLSAWKWWKLFAPTLSIRYNFNNIITDLEKLFTVDPAQLDPRRILIAYREVRDFFKTGKPPTEELRLAAQNGVLEGVTERELSEIRQGFAQFEALLTRSEKNKRWWTNKLLWGQNFARLREATFRYNAFKINLERMRNGAAFVPGGALRRDVEFIRDAWQADTEYRRITQEIKNTETRLAMAERNWQRFNTPETKGLREAAFNRLTALRRELEPKLKALREQLPAIEAKARDNALAQAAALIAKKTFGDYDAISVNGDFIRRQLIPFYSWMEVNFEYHANVFRNLLDVEAVAGRNRAKAITKTAALTAASLARQALTSGFVIRLALLYSGIAGFNAIMRVAHNIEDDELSEEDRRRLHVIVGRTADGKPQLIYLNTAFADVARWFGGNEFMRLATDVAAGRMTLQDAATQWATNAPKDIVNNLIQGIRPDAKALITAATGYNPFPDIFEMRKIPAYDMRRYMLSQITDEFTANQIEALVNKDYWDPKDYGTWAKQLILQVRERDPEQWAYYAIRDKAEAFLAERGRDTEPGTSNKPEAQVVRNFRRCPLRGRRPRSRLHDPSRRIPLAVCLLSARTTRPNPARQRPRRHPAHPRRWPRRLAPRRHRGRTLRPPRKPQARRRCLMHVAS